jgi:hypothetical protein
MATDRKIPSVRTLALLSGDEFNRFSSLHSLNVELIERIRHASANLIECVEGLETVRSSKYVELTWRPRTSITKDQHRELVQLLVVWKQVHLDMDERKLSFPAVSALVAKYDQRNANIVQGWVVSNMQPLDTTKMTFRGSVRSDDETTREAQHVAAYIEKYTRNAA